MQIPTGVLVDSWGARRLLIAGSLAAAAGTCLFGLTSSYALASIGRAIVGGRDRGRLGRHAEAGHSLVSAAADSPCSRASG